VRKPLNERPTNSPFKESPSDTGVGTHAVLGLGAVGGLVATALAHAGEGVTALVRAESFATHPSALHLWRPMDTIEARVHLATKLEEPVDVLWVAVKAHQLVAALHAIPDPAIARTVVPLLNGIEHVELLRSRLGESRVVPATISVEAERPAPGQVVQRSPFARLAISLKGSDGLQRIADRLRSEGFRCEFPWNEKAMLWQKLAFLAPFALVGTASDKDKQGIFADNAWRGQLESAIDEVCAVCAAEKAFVGPEEILAKLESLPAAMRSSMHKDVARGHTPELDAIGGVIVRRARKHGFDVPTTRQLVARIEERVVQNKNSPGWTGVNSHLS
jgi:2-dehydropantoate 2-reductase